MVWFGKDWYGFVSIVWYGGGQMTSEFINEEISMLFCSKKFAGGWVVGGWLVWSDYRVNLQVQT